MITHKIKPIFSFVVPVYNAEKYLKKCVCSIINQSCSSFEIILVNDGSTDNSKIICEKLSKSDTRIKIINKANEGPGVARNVGIKASKGNYIIFCDADDYYCRNDFLETINNKIKSANTDIVVFNYQNLFNKLVPSRKCITELKESYKTGKEFLIDALNIRYDYRWYPFLYAFRKELFLNGKIVFPSKKLGEDTATIYKLILNSKRMQIIGDTFYVYRRNSGNNCSSVKNYDVLHGIIGIAKECIENVLSRNDLSSNLKCLLCNNFATAYFIALIQADSLTNEEYNKLIGYLNVEKKITQYAISPKQVIATKMIRLFGLRKMTKLLRFRKKIRLNKK